MAHANVPTQPGTHRLTIVAGIENSFDRTEEASKILCKKTHGTS
jgi:hypothetical protein